MLAFFIISPRVQSGTANNKTEFRNNFNKFKEVFTIALRYNEPEAKTTPYGVGGLEN